MHRASARTFSTEVTQSKLWRLHTNCSGQIDRACFVRLAQTLFAYFNNNGTDGFLDQLILKGISKDAVANYRIIVIGLCKAKKDR